jgi:hypothetical protein
VPPNTDSVTKYWQYHQILTVPPITDSATNYWQCHQLLTVPPNTDSVTKYFPTSASIQDTTASFNNTFNSLLINRFRIGRNKKAANRIVK